MTSLKRQKGFTLVELLIVIIIIGILATLVIVTFTGIQAKARDSKRQTDINAIQSTVEAFHAQYGFYPTAAELQSATFQAAHLKGFDPAALKDPKSNAYYTFTASGSDSAGTCDNTATPADNVDGTPADNGCSSYTVSATLESNNQAFTKQSNG